MDGRSVTVAIVVDPAYLCLTELVEQMPVWAIDVPAHRAVAEAEWKSRGPADAWQGITLFKVTDELDRLGNLLDALDQVDLHHGVYSSGSRIEVLKVIGVSASTEVFDELRPYGFIAIDPTADGFLARAGGVPNATTAPSA